MRELPEQARRLLISVDAPPRLLAHHAMVHDVVVTLVEGIERNWPNVPLDKQAALFGAATHDIGKSLHEEEMRGPGRLHENDGPALLTKLGVSEALARFARTHAQWALEPDPTIEDMLVALANTLWTGARNEHLEQHIIRYLVERNDEPEWSVFARFDDILLEALEGSGERYALYRAIPDDADD